MSRDSGREPPLGHGASLGQDSGASFTPPPSVGTQLAERRQLGQYEIVRPIGRGGMGTVYEAVHSHLRRRVALKTISGHRLTDTSAVKRFHREMAAIGMLDHPHIVRASDAGEIEGTLFLVMDLIDGCDVDSLVKAVGPLRIADACEIVRQAALALDYAHGHGLVHRDVKPSNLLMDRKGTVKLGDLGLSRLYGNSSPKQSSLSSGAVVGTADYLAPEQAQRESVLDGRTDIYSLGCTLFQLLTGRVPFSGSGYDTPIRKVLAHLQVAPPPVAQFRSELPDALAKLVHRMLAKERDERLATAAELVRALEPFCGGADLQSLMKDVPAATGSADIIGSSRLLPELQSTKTLVGQLTSRFPVSRRWRPGMRRTTYFAAAMGVFAVGWLALDAGWFRAKPQSRPEPPPAVVPVPVAAPLENETPPAVASPAKPVFQELRPDEIERLRWYSLFEREPTPLVWWDAQGRSSWDFDPNLSQLTVSSQSDSLMTLGEVSAGDYTLEVEFYQHQWTGNIGVFFGLHQMELGDNPQWQAQVIELDLDRSKNASSPFCLTRSFSKLRRLNGEFWISGSAGLTPTVPVMHPGLQPQVLRIEVHGNRLKSVRWAGAYLYDLCELEVDNMVPPNGFHGQFGVYSKNFAIFRDARIMLH